MTHADNPDFMIEEEVEAEERLFQEMTALIARLREQGVIVSGFLLAVPVVLEGTLSTGEEFTLRCRYQKCQLMVGGKTLEQTTKLDGTPFERYEAGCLTSREAAEMLAHLLGKAGYADAEHCVRAAII